WPARSTSSLTLLAFRSISCDAEAAAGSAAARTARRAAARSITENRSTSHLQIGSLAGGIRRVRLRAMAVLTSQAAPDAQRRARMEELVAELRERTAQVARGGGEAALEKHRSRGKLTARERIDRLVDPDSAFLE